MRQPLTIATYAWVILVALIAARIEWLNYAAGSPLPRIDRGKWRQDSGTNEQRWRETTATHYTNGEPLLGKLTPEQRAQMERDTSKARTWNALRNWVSFPGLLQYLLIPVTIIHIVVVLARSPDSQRSRLMAPAILLVALATASLVFRQYFSSLGP